MTLLLALVNFTPDILLQSKIDFVITDTKVNWRWLDARFLFSRLVPQGFL